MGTLRRNCAKVREPSELRFGVVRRVGRGIGVDGGPIVQGEGEVLWVYVPRFLLLGNPKA